MCGGENKVNGDGEIVASQGPFSIEWEGSLNRTGAGDLQNCSVMVEDVSGPIGYALTPDSISGNTGESPGGSFTVKVADNYPFSDGSISGELVYSTVLNDWVQEPGEKELCGDAYHPHPNICNCMAYHKERWVWKSIPFDASSPSIISGSDGKPAYAVYEVTIPDSIEPLPWHFAGLSYSYDYKDGSFLNFSPCQLKAFVVAQDHHGFGPSSPYGDNEENAQASETVSPGSPRRLRNSKP